jgi:hypothetical protein
VYGIQLPNVPMDFYVSLDGNVLPEPVVFLGLQDGSPALYNATLFDIQALALSLHTLTLMLNGTVPGYPYPYIIFDYALVNETASAPNLSSSSTSPISAAHHSSFPVGAVVGGCVGGLVGVVTITCALLYCRRKKPTPAPTEPNTQPNTTQYDPYYTGTYPPQQTITHTPSSAPLHSTTPLYSNQTFTSFPSQNSNSPSHAGVLIPTAAVDSGDKRLSSIPSQGKGPNSGTLSWRPESPNDRNIPNQLTEEQAAYVQNMYSLNMPATAIALVVERMLQEGGTPSEISASGSGVRRGNTNATMPPSYTDS